MLISVHPKTGGTSFQTILTHIFGEESLFLDYDNIKARSANVGRSILPVPEGVKEWILDKGHQAQFFRYAYTQYLRHIHHLDQEPLEGIACVHGHFKATKYRHRFPDGLLVTWVRDPVQRLISEYYHMVNRRRDAPDWFTRSTPSLESFLLDRRTYNTMSYYLDDIALSSFDFVGIMEDYPGSLERFKALLQRQGGIEVPSELRGAHENRRAIHSTLDILDQSIALQVLNCNQRDVQLYTRAMQMHRA